MFGVNCFTFFQIIYEQDAFRIQKKQWPRPFLQMGLSSPLSLLVLPCLFWLLFSLRHMVVNPERVHRNKPLKISVGLGVKQYSYMIKRAFSFDMLTMSVTSVNSSRQLFIMLLLIFWATFSVVADFDLPDAHPHFYSCKLRSRLLQCSI